MVLKEFKRNVQPEGKVSSLVKAYRGSSHWSMFEHSLNENIQYCSIEVIKSTNFMITWPENCVMREASLVKRKNVSWHLLCKVPTLFYMQCIWGRSSLVPVARTVFICQIKINNDWHMKQKSMRYFLKCLLCTYMPPSLVRLGVDNTPGLTNVTLCRGWIFPHLVPGLLGLRRDEVLTFSSIRGLAKKLSF